MHLADAFIQSDLECIQAIHLYCQYMCSLGIIFRFVFTLRLQIFSQILSYSNKPYTNGKKYLFSFQMKYKSQFKKKYPYDWFCGPGWLHSRWSYSRSYSRGITVYEMSTMSKFTVFTKHKKTKVQQNLILFILHTLIVVRFVSRQM